MHLLKSNRNCPTTRTLSEASLSTPPAKRIRTQSGLPRPAADVSAVCPFCVLSCSTRAKYSNEHDKGLIKTNRGYRPHTHKTLLVDTQQKSERTSSFASLSTPLSISSRTQSVRPKREAWISAVHPSWVCHLPPQSVEPALDRCDMYVGNTQAPEGYV